MKRNNWLWIAGLTVALAAVTAQAQSSALVHEGFTRPSRELKLNFNGGGTIKEVNVKRGDSIKAGQVLMAEDDRMERKALESLEIEANSKLAREAARIELEQKKVELGRYEEMFKKQVASKSELEKARLDVQMGELQVKLTAEKLAQKALEAARQRDKVELMKLLSPIDGVVQEIGVDVGEVADPNNPNRPACVVVQNDPLWVVVQLPAEQAARLKSDDTIEVKYADGAAWHKTKIIFFDPVADARSGTQRLHLELPNPAGRAAGLQVMVKLPAHAALATR